MDLYDTIFFDCPECGYEVSYLTKNSGDKIYQDEAVPVNIADSITGNTIYCNHCGDRFTIMVDKTISQTIPLFLRKVF